MEWRYNVLLEGKDQFPKSGLTQMAYELHGIGFTEIASPQIENIINRLNESSCYLLNPCPHSQYTITVTL